MAEVQTKQKQSDVVTDLKGLSRSNAVRKVNWLGKKVEVRKLTLAECMEIQKMAQGTDSDNPEQGFNLLKQTIRQGVPAAADFTDEDFEEFPMEDLNQLSTEVLKLAGMAPPGK